MRPPTLILAVLAALVCAADASALTWTPARELPRHDVSGELTGPPPVAINRRGDIVMQWTGVLGADEVAVGNATSLRSVDLPGYQGPVHGLAIAPSGQAIVAFDWFKSTESDAVPAYALVSRGGKAGRVHPLRGARQIHFAAQPNGSYLAVYVTARGVVARPISAAGRPGKPRRLGSGRLSAFASAPGGQAIVCCGASNGTWRYSPSKGWSTVSAANRVRSVATAAGRFHTTSQGTALVDGSGRTFTLDSSAVAGAFGAGALVVSPQSGRWGVQREQDGTFTPVATLPADVAHAGIATAGDAAVLAWYGDDHRAFLSFARP